MHLPSVGHPGGTHCQPRGASTDTAAADPLEEGRAAFRRRAWTDAHLRLAAAQVASPLPAGDLERLATAAHLAGADQDATTAWTDAHHAHLDGGAPAPAARCAFWLGWVHLQRGDHAQGGGWMARARRLVEEHDLDGVERGYLQLPDGLAHLHGGDVRAAHAAFAEAGAVATRFGDADLAALSRLGRGQALRRDRRTDEALACFDEVMVAVTADELSPVVAGIVYCGVIAECHDAGDVRRATEWTDALTRWCGSQPDLVPYRGQCLVHRSQVMQLRGAWDDALDLARAALEDEVVTRLSPCTDPDGALVVDVAALLTTGRVPG